MISLIFPPDHDCLVDENVGLPESFDVFRVLKKNVALVARVGEAGVGGFGDGQRLQLVPFLVHLLLVVPQTLVLPVHPEA